MGPPRFLTSRPEAGAMYESSLTPHESGLPPNSSGNHHGHRRAHELSGILHSCPIFYKSGNSAEMGSNLPKFSELPKKLGQDSTVGLPESKGQILSTIPRSSHEGTDFR